MIQIMEKSPEALPGGVTGVSLGALLLVGCASDSSRREPASYQQMQRQELESERREYIADTRERIAEISQDIEHLKVKLEHEAKFVDQSQSASWSQELFELEQERNRLTHSLDRAQTASPQEWRQMRGAVGAAVDSLQAGVKKLSSEVASLVSGNETTAGSETMQQGMKPDLCLAEIPEMDAEIEERSDVLLVVMTTSDSKELPTLRRSARELAKQAQYPKQRHQSTESQRDQSIEKQRDQSTPAHGLGSRPTSNLSEQSAARVEQSTQEPIQVEITMEEVNGGARLTFQPKNGDRDLKLLRDRLKEDVEAVDNGACGTAARG